MIGIYIVMGLAVAGIFGIAAVQSGGFENSFESFFGYLLSWEMMSLIIVVGVVFIAIKNSMQKEPMWKKDLIGLSVSIIIIFVVAFLVPFAGGQLYGYTADVEITLWNPSFLTDPFGKQTIRAIWISNFARASPLSIAERPMPLGFIGETINGDITVRCDGEIVDHNSFGVWVNYGFEGTATRKISNLKSGGNCVVTVTIPTDVKSKQFIVPSLG